MPEKLNGKRAVVTGGGSGIGREIARCFSVEGAFVHILGRDRQKLEETRLLCSDRKRVAIHAFDLATPGEIARFAEKLQGAGEAVHVLVNCAGVFRSQPIDSTTDEDFSEMVEVNLSAAFRLIRGLLPLMREACGGAIVNIATTLAYMPEKGCTAYSVSKAGLLMLTKSVALECAAQGIRCNTISPGVVRTPIFETVMGADQVEAHLGRMAAAHPLGRVGEVADIARAALFLASDDAAWITGINLPVDGGISLT